jgi:cytochrome c peroxidase
MTSFFVRGFRSFRASAHTRRACVAGYQPLMAAALSVFSACGSTEGAPVGAAEPALGSAREALSAYSGKPQEGSGPQMDPHRRRMTGEQLFNEPFPGTNGRSCATCHVAADNFTLTPAHVQKLLETNPDDPLFNKLDADDPNATPLTFEHLKKGLVRVILDLPDNMDLIDAAGNVTTPADRTVSVWRAVPSVVNAAITAPFQYDGRAASLQDQAQGAILAHSEGRATPRAELDKIADFQNSQFSSGRARFVAKELARGVEREDVPDVDARMHLTRSERRGRELYNQACEVCHGGPAKNQIVDREIHDLAFGTIKPDGNLLYTVPATTPPTPVLSSNPDNEFLNLGFAFLTQLAQFGFPGIFNATVEFPRYRYRFYTDGTRSQQLVDLPPPPQLASDDPAAAFSPKLDADGNPIVGPNLLPQFFSTDPGRAAITGQPIDFEAFDMPPLRGVAKTAPYFHDNSAETLKDAVDFYSRFILQVFTPLNLPPVNPPETEGGPPESFTPKQKRDLLAFLNRL